MIYMCSRLQKAKEECIFYYSWLILSPKSPLFFHFHLTVCNINLENIQKEQLTQQPFQIVTSDLVLQV